MWETLSEVDKDVPDVVAAIYKFFSSIPETSQTLPCDVSVRIKNNSMFYAIPAYAYTVMMKLLEQKVKRQNSENSGI